MPEDVLFMDDEIVDCVIGRSRRNGVSDTLRVR
jgi:hypothetical protein